MRTAGTKRFADKLDELPQTLRLVLADDHARLSASIKASNGRPALAVGSGGSAITAAYFERCRETLTDELTKTMTPLEFTVGAGDLRETDVWLFSAGADNPDFAGALRSAQTRRANHVTVLTRRKNAALLSDLADAGNLSVHVVPVASEKDSFLATHSLASSVAALLVASAAASNDPAGGVGAAFEAASVAALASGRRRPDDADPFRTLKTDDTVLIIADPQAATVAALLETSIWEASICSVQRTDFRNFAHGRHTWLHHRGARTLILALTGHDTEVLWERTSAQLPANVRRVEMNFGNCGRYRNALGVIEGLVAIERMGRAVGIDPGKPGIGEFGKPLYEDDGLKRLADKLGPALRQKRRAKLAHDDPACRPGAIYEADRERLARFSTASIGGVAFDYDGTIVATERRLEPPTAALIDELKRLHALGVRIAIATGRGGSAGEMLRQVLPAEMHGHILMGYYNGGYVRRLDVDIRDDPPDTSPAIAAVADWLANRRDLFSTPYDGGHSRVQISIQSAKIADVETLVRESANCGPIASAAVRVTRSGHSLDIVPADSSKAAVAEKLAEGLVGDAIVLRVGDQGAPDGNDHEFLSHPFGISVEAVCGRDDGCWSFHGGELTGPAALLRLLRALQPRAPGLVQINLDLLERDGELEYKKGT